MSLFHTEIHAASEADGSLKKVVFRVKADFAAELDRLKEFLHLGTAKVTHDGSIAQVEIHPAPFPEIPHAPEIEHPTPPVPHVPELHPTSEHSAGPGESKP